MNAADIFYSLKLDYSVKQLVDERLKKTFIKKGELLLNPGETADCQYYVVSGCLRSYYVDHASKEHTIQFAISDWWISDYTAFYKQEKAILFVECIQDATLFQLSRDDMQDISDQSPEVERFFRLKTESYISSFQKRIIGDLAKSAKEHYTDFVKAYPNIEQLVKNYHIASYLGITSESLSRVRKELAQE